MKIHKILLICLGLLLSIQTSWAQTGKREQRKIERAEKKRLKAEERQKKHEWVLGLIQEKSYVLEATRLSGRYGEQYQVNPSTNFVKIEGDQIIVQTANNHSIGYNGLGGITINGTIQDYSIADAKNGVSIMIRFSDPVMGMSTLNLDVQESGNAQARVVGGWGGRVVFQGQVVALEESRVFKGRTII